VPTLVTALGAHPIEDRHVDAATLAAATGWELKPEGLCRGDVCLLVPDALRQTPTTVDVVALWRHLGRPVLESNGDIYLGEDATTKADAMAGDRAPDFTLPDLDGVEHSLSDFRGKKVLISSWAPW
jgi:hypothetical protein